MADLPTIFSWFETDDVPTQEQFQQTLSSFLHKEENIAISKITGLENALNDKLGNAHATDLNAHNYVLARRDAENLDAQNVESWRTVLAVGDIPDNVALVDMGEPQDVYNKQQIHEMTMMIADYVVSGKIRADKIEALGLTDLIAATETTLATFVANSLNYEFQKNDFIAIPNGAGNYSLFIFKGGVKTVQANYLPTGLTNITIAMVDGLQTALDNKIDKPARNGSFFTKKVGSATTQRLINPSVNYLIFWNGVDFSATNIFRDPISGRMGIGTISPSEQLQLMGRLRTAALVLDENSEGLPQQITYNSGKFYGTDSTGQKRQLMFADFEGYKALWLSLTDAQKTEIKTIANGGFTTNTMSVFLINPMIIDRTITTNQYISLLGANLNFNPINFSVEIMDSTGTTLVASVPNSNVQLQSNGLSLIFHYNFNTLPAGTYKLRLSNGVAAYTTQVTFELRNTVDNYDLTGLTWSKKVYNDLLLPYFNSSPNSVNFNGDLKNIDGTDFNEDSISADFITVASRTSMIGSMSDDFVIEVSINNPSTFTFALSSIGITTSSSDNLINDLIVRAQIGGWGNANIGDGSVNVPANNNNNDRFIIIKKGQLLQYIITGSSQAFTKTVSVTNSNIPFFIKTIRNNGGTTNGGNTSITTGNIISAYKIN